MSRDRRRYRENRGGRSLCTSALLVEQRDLVRRGRETLANLSKTGHLRCFSDQPVAEIVQCGEPIPIHHQIKRLRAATGFEPYSVDNRRVARTPIARNRERNREHCG